MRICPICSTTYPTQVGFCPKDGSPLGDLHEWMPGATIRGKYRILGVVGRGGMGSVYKASHLGFDELRALKLLKQELAADTRFVKRFKQEAFTTRKLQHPNIVRVEDIDETEEGQPFIVMEFIEGRNLRSLIEKHGTMKTAAACSIMKQIASALVMAHGLGVIHRDLKPDNIVLVDPAKAAGTAAGPTVKVLDFGIAKLKEVRAEGNPNDSALTLPGLLLGTPEYMSPEQAKGKRGDELDGRSDIYSLGIVMYQMLTGMLPFEAATTMEMLLAQAQQLPRPLRSVRPDLHIPESLAGIVMQCLEKSCESRPQTAQALIQALDCAEAMDAAAPVRYGSPVAAPPVTGAELDQDRKAPMPLAPEAAPVGEHEPLPAEQGERGREMALAAAQGVAGPNATAMVPNNEAAIAEGLPAIPAVARQEQPPPAEAPTRHTSPVVVPQSSRGTDSAIVLAVALVLAIEFLIFNRPSAAPNSGVTVEMVRPEPSASPVSSSTPARIAMETDKAATKDKLRESSTSKAVVLPSPTTPGEQSRTPELDKKIQDAIAEGDLHHRHAEYDEAIRIYQAALKLAPSNAEVKILHERIKGSESAKAAELGLPK